MTVWALFEGAKQEQEVSWNLGEKKKKKIVGKGWEGGGENLTLVFGLEVADEIRHISVPPLSLWV